MCACVARVLSVRVCLSRRDPSRRDLACVPCRAVQGASIALAARSRDQLEAVAADCTAAGAKEVSVPTHLCRHAHAHVCVHVNAHVHTRVCVHVYPYKYTFIRVYQNVYANVHTHAYTLVRTQCHGKFDGAYPTHMFVCMPVLQIHTCDMTDSAAVNALAEDLLKQHDGVEVHMPWATTGGRPQAISPPGHTVRPDATIGHRPQALRH